MLLAAPGKVPEEHGSKNDKAENPREGVADGKELDRGVGLDEEHDRGELEQGSDHVSSKKYRASLRKAASTVTIRLSSASTGTSTIKIASMATAAGSSIKVPAMNERAPESHYDQHPEGGGESTDEGHRTQHRPCVFVLVKDRHVARRTAIHTKLHGSLEDSHHRKCVSEGSVIAFGQIADDEDLRHVANKRRHDASSQQQAGSTDLAMRLRIDRLANGHVDPPNLVVAQITPAEFSRPWPFSRTRPFGPGLRTVSGKKKWVYTRA